MKILLKLILLLLPLWVAARDIPVPVGSDLTPYIAQANAGDNVLLQAGSYTISGNARVKPGVWLTGAGIDKTFITNRTFNWWTGAIQLALGDGGGQVISGFTLTGAPNAAFEGIKVEARSNVVIEKVKVVGFVYTGIEIQSYWEQTLSNVTVQDFEIHNSSCESNAGSFGNLILRGDLKNIKIQRFYIRSDLEDSKTAYGAAYTGSGYGIKSFSNWKDGGFSSNEWQRKILIKDGRFSVKPKAKWGGNVPNFNEEIWNVNAEDFEITGCDFDGQLSLEHGFQKPTARSFWVHDNTFKVRNGQSIELTASYSLVEKNNFSFANNSGWKNLFGTYNMQRNIRDIIFRYNTVDMAGHSVIIANSRGQYVNLLVENNIFKNGNPVLVYYESGAANGATVTFRNNTLPANFTQSTFKDIAAGSVSLNLVKGTASIPDGPIVKPPVTEPPVVVPPTPKPDSVIVKTKTITITRREVTGTPVITKDTVSKQYSITIPYTVTETKTEQ